MNKKKLEQKNVLSEERLTDKISSISINIPEKDFDFLFSDIPTSLRTYQKGKALVDNLPEQYNVSLRIRGNHAWHWNKEKPSFRLRVRGNKKIYERSELDFVNPDDPSGFSNFLANIMASKVGLSHFKLAFGQVTINSKYRGLYHITDPIASSNLITDDNIKGTIVNGNSWDRQIWDNHKLWEIESGITEELKLNIEKCLEKLLSNLVRPINPDFAHNLKLCVDMKKFARWSAFMTAIGSVHTDDFHNNFFAYDSDSERLLPVIADPSGFGVLTSVSNENNKSGIEIPLYEFLTPLQDLAFRDPEYLYSRNKYLYEYIENTISPTYLEEISNKWRKTIEPFYYMEKDTAGAVITVPKMLFPIRLPVSASYRINDIDRLIDFYNRRCEFLRKELNKCEVEVFKCDGAELGNVENICPYIVRVRGNAPYFLSLKENEKCWLDTNLDGKLDSSEATSTLMLYPAVKRSDYSSNDGTNWLMLGSRYADYILTPEWQTYLIGVEVTENKQLEDMFSKGNNAITGKPVAVAFSDQTFDADNLYKHSESLHIWSAQK